MFKSPGLVHFTPKVSNLWTSDFLVYCLRKTLIRSTIKKRCNENREKKIQNSGSDQAKSVSIAIISANAFINLVKIINDTIVVIRCLFHSGYIQYTYGIFLSVNFALFLFHIISNSKAYILNVVDNRKECDYNAYVWQYTHIHQPDGLIKENKNRHRAQWCDCFFFQR